jgi:hypothetical protein
MSPKVPTPEDQDVSKPIDAIGTDEYNHFEHRHRFAVWAGARAAQRGLTTVEHLRAALESTDIKAFVEESSAIEIGAQAFEILHRKWCNAIMSSLESGGITNATFGRAAKLVAVYLKAMIVVGTNAQSSLAAIVHPPIDRNLLQNLASSPDIKSPHSAMWRSIAWTKLDETAYYELLVTLRTAVPVPEPWWKLEQYWTVTNE